MCGGEPESRDTRLTAIPAPRNRCAPDLRATLRIGSLKDRKTFLADIPRTVTVNRGGIEIEYRLPVSEERIEEVLSPVLTGVAFGGAGVNDLGTSVLSSSWA